MNKWLAQLSIKRKLMMIIMLVSSAAVLLASGAFFIYQWYNFRERMIYNLSIHAEMLADTSTAALSFDNPEDATELLQALKIKHSIIMGAIYRGNGSLLSVYRRFDIPTDTPLPHYSEEGYHFYKDRLELFKTVQLNHRPIGMIYLCMDLDELSVFFNRSLLAIFFMIVLISAVSYTLSAKLQRIVSMPIQHLADTARTISVNQDYSLRAIKENHDELGQLTDAFNSMLEQIATRDSTLHDLRSLLSNIINSMPSILVGVDKNGLVTQWNLEAEKSTGISSEKAQGSPLEKVFPQMTNEITRIHDAIAQRLPQRKSKIPFKKEKEVRFADITVYPLIANGVEGAVIRIDDITDQVRMEEMMIQSEKMMSVGGLAAGMAHEINNPLAGILQNIQVMRNRFSSTLAKNQSTAIECGANMETITAYMEKRGIFPMMEAIMESGQRASQIVDNMLSFSRKSDSKCAPCHIDQLIDKTVELAANDYDLKKKYDFRKIKIIREYQPDLPEVWCESSKIQQVLLNLLKNGAEAIKEKAENLKAEEAHDKLATPLEPPHFILRLKQEDEMVRIEVEDNGPGIPEEIRKRIFEPFFTTKEVGLGTGLGLSVSYFIITENHGGTMTVESIPGKSTTFIIRIPIQRGLT